MKYAPAALAIALLTQAAPASAHPRHQTPDLAAERIEYGRFRAIGSPQWGVGPGLQLNGSGCAPGKGSPVWGLGNALLGYSCSDSANGS
jgi:hypothetical protein